MSTLKFFHVCGNISMILISYLAYPSRMNRAVDSVFIWIHTITQQNFKQDKISLIETPPIFFSFRAIFMLQP